MKGTLLSPGHPSRVTPDTPCLVPSQPVVAVLELSGKLDTFHAAQIQHVSLRATGVFVLTVYMVEYPCSRYINQAHCSVRV